MNKKTILLLGQFAFMVLLKNEMYCQSVSVTIQYGGYITQCCSANTTDYFCFNSPNSTGYCGNTTICNTQSFFDSVPSGNMVTQIAVNYHSAGCAGGSMIGSLNSISLGSVAEANTGCLCTNTIWASTGSTISNYTCGISGYNYGANNNFTFCASGGQICIDKCVITLTYAPAIFNLQATKDSICIGETDTLIASGASTYTWSANAGGANTSTVSVSPVSNETYTVTGTDLISGCISTATQVIYVSNCTTDINQLLGNFNQIRFFPNPANQFLTVELNNAELFISDIVGNIIMYITAENEITTIDISSLNNGVYFLKTKTTENVFTKKFIVQK